MRPSLSCVLLTMAAIWMCIVFKFMSGIRFEPRNGASMTQADKKPTRRWRPALPANLRGWKMVETLFMVGQEDPEALAWLLEEEDPLGVRTTPEDFLCPPLKARFSFPDVRNHTVEMEFKQGEGFIYYQHLRKAGGTGFCEMAGRNMPKHQVPVYHCMPDNRGSMATPPWSNPEVLLSRMKQAGHRITANEWDIFPVTHLDLPGAVFGTTLRHPVDRWYSQYRFEHVEHRDGTKQDSPVAPFERWYDRVKPYVMGDNYYVKTFCGAKNPPDEVVMQKPNQIKDLSWTYHQFNSWGSKVSWQNFVTAVETLRRFNLLLLLDFVNDEMWALEETLGWTEKRKQVLPHEQQFLRKDKKSIPAREALSPEVWSSVLQSNVFDLLLYHWAKRMYLERRACRESDHLGDSIEAKSI